jgi:hypothetical protein
VSESLKIPWTMAVGMTREKSEMMQNKEMRIMLEYVCDYLGGWW